MIILSKETARALAKKAGIVAAQDRIIGLNAGKTEKGVILRSICAAPDETVGLQLNTFCESGSLKGEGETFECAVKSAEFVSILEAVASVAGEGDKVSLTLKKSALTVKTKAVELKLDTVEIANVIAISADQQTSRFVAKLGKADLLHLLKDSAVWYEDTDKICNTIWYIRAKSLSVHSSNGSALAYDTAPAAVKPGVNWEKGVEVYKKAHPDSEDTCLINVPGMFVGVLASALAQTDMEKITIMADAKYLHVLLDSGMVSVRLAGSGYDPSAFIQWINAEIPATVLVDKATLETAVKLIRKRVALAKGVSNMLGICLKGSDKGLFIKVGDNAMLVPFVGGNKDAAADVEFYINPKFLEEGLNTVANGTMVLKVADRYVAFGNGDENAFAVGANKLMVMGITPNEAKKAEADFVAGVDVTAKEEKEKAKAEKKADKKPKTAKPAPEEEEEDSEDEE